MKLRGLKNVEWIYQDHQNHLWMMTVRHLGFTWTCRMPRRKHKNLDDQLNGRHVILFQYSLSGFSWCMCFGLHEFSREIEGKLRRKMRGFCNCELCGKKAKTYCESDQAKLCWHCDQKVHGANFLVAKHLRCLLCHACQSPTPWKADGPKLLPTVSFCEGCVGVHMTDTNNLEEDGDNHYQLDHASTDDNSNDDGEFSSVSDYEEHEFDDGGDESMKEEGDNQVVPLAFDGASSPAHVLSCSNSNEEISSSGDAVMGAAGGLSSNRFGREFN